MEPTDAVPSLDDLQAAAISQWKTDSPELLRAAHFDLNEIRRRLRRRPLRLILHLDSLTSPGLFIGYFVSHLPAGCTYVHHPRDTRDKRAISSKRWKHAAAIAAQSKTVPRRSDRAWTNDWESPVPESWIALQDAYTLYTYAINGIDRSPIELSADQSAILRQALGPQHG